MQSGMFFKFQTTLIETMNQNQNEMPTTIASPTDTVFSTKVLNFSFEGFLFFRRFNVIWEVVPKFKIENY